MHTSSVARNPQGMRGSRQLDYMTGEIMDHPSKLNRKASSDAGPSVPLSKVWW